MKNTRGFSVVEGLLILVLVGLLGGVGYYVYNANKNASDTYSNAAGGDVPKYKLAKTFAECKAAAGSKIQETYPEVCVTKAGKKFTNPDQAKEAKEVSSWLLYESLPTEHGHKYKVRLADGWDLVRYMTALYTYNSKNLELKTGTNAKVTSSAGGRDGVAALSIRVVDNDNEYYNQSTNVSGKLQSTLKTHSGTSISKYYEFYEKGTAGIGPFKDSKEYSYVVKGDHVTVVAVYVQIPGENDLHELVEKVVKTIEVE